MSVGEHSLQPMSVGLATIDPDLIFREAKRQYEALVRMHDGQEETPTRTRAQQHIGLPQHYRNLFDSATASLDEWEKHRLLVICFAYKSKARVLQYLGLLDDGAFPWVPLFKSIVGDCAKDTVFEETVMATGGEMLDEERAPVLGPLAAFKFQYMAKKALQLSNSQEQDDIDTTANALPGVIPTLQANPQSPYGLHSKTAVAKATPIKHTGPYFVISTLPIAFPQTFFMAFALHAPLSNLTMPSMLSYPSAMQLALSRPLKSLLRANLPNFWKRSMPLGGLDRYATSRQHAEEEASWTAFFEHLLQNRVVLSNIDGQPYEIDEGEDGYGEEDLGMWLAWWIADRQSVGMKEKGQATMLKVKLGLGGNDIEAVVDVEDFDEDGGGIQLVDEMGKRVSWNEEGLETVKEIPGRVKRKKKIRRNW